MDEKYKILQQVLGKERIKSNEPLSQYVFSKIGGPAQYFYIATMQKEFIEALTLAKQLNIPFFIIGNGTKMLISKKGLLGFVIKNRTNSLKISGIKGRVAGSGLGIEEALIEVDSGVSLSKLNEFLRQQGLKPILTFSSLHSTVGGALLLDPSFNGVTQKIKVWDDGEIDEIELEDIKKKQIILSVLFKIKADVAKIK